MAEAVEWLLDLASPLAYLVVFAFAFAEGGLLIGLFLPGEAPVLLAGVLAFEGRVSLPLVLAVAVVAAVTGDSTGYLIGRLAGPRLRRTRLGRRVGDHRWQRAHDYLRERGGRAVFFGRFVSIFRTLVPPVAGMSHMPYRKFVRYNAPAAALYSSALVLAGYLAGHSWHAVERWLGRASLVLLIIALVVVGFVLAARWAAAHYADLRTRMDALRRRPAVASLLRRYEREIAFIRRRFDRGQRLGLVLTAALALVLLTGLAFGSVTEDVLDRETGSVDVPVVLWLQDHRHPSLTAALRVVTFLGAPAFAAGVLGVAALVAYFRTDDLRMPAFLAFCLAGAAGLAPAVKLLVGRGRPEFSQLVEVGHLAFPSGHATASAVLYAALAYLLTRGRPWRFSVWVWTGAGIMSFLVGFSRVYLGVHWPSDVVGGWLLGLMWVGIGIVATDLVWEREQPPAEARYPAA